MEKNYGFFEKTLGERLKDIETRIRRAKIDAPLAPAHTQLMGASKMQTAETIREAIAAGLNWFGENRVQEAEEKWPVLKAEFPQVKLHLLGPLQTNKVKDAVRLFDGIQSIDRIKLADALADEMQKRNRRPDCFIQINTGEEKQKSGALPQDADALIAYVRDELKLPLKGLMCIPPERDYPAAHFALLRKIASAHGLDELSMGMSGDYELATRMGATIVRVGLALFGSRDGK